MSLSDDPPQTLPPTQLARPRRPTFSARKLTLLGGLVVALVAALIGAGYWLARSDQSVHDTATATPGFVIATRTPTPGPSATATPAPVPFPPTGWRATSVITQDVAFADPTSQIGYACGADGATFGVSHTNDAGATWQPPVALPVATAEVATGECVLTVNPTNPLDLAVILIPCATGCASTGNNAVFRSLNGGQSWITLVVPDNAAGEYAPDAALGYAGSVLIGAAALVAGGSIPPPPPHPLLLSDGGKPFVWGDIPLYQPGASGERAPLASAYAPPVVAYDSLGTSLIAVEQFGGPGAPQYPLKTTDGGATWHPLALSGAAAGGTFFGTTPDGFWLIVIANDGTVLISSDQGGTWQRLPPLPVAANQTEPLLLVARDGDAFTENLLGPTPYLARAAPGAGAWTGLIALPPIGFAALSQSPRGAPTAIYALLIGAGLGTPLGQEAWLPV